MRKLNLIVVFNQNLKETLFCIRAKEPYKGLYNFVGGRVEEFKKYSYALCRIDVVDLKKGFEVLKVKENIVDNQLMIPNETGAAYLSIGMAEIVTFPGTCGFCFNEIGKKFLESIFE